MDAVKHPEKKAARLVNDRKVTVDYWRTEQDRIVYCKGTVEGDHGRYTVTGGMDGSCDCLQGLNRPGHRHSHTIALELAAWNEARKVTT